MSLRKSARKQGHKDALDADLSSLDGWPDVRSFAYERAEAFASGMKRQDAYWMGFYYTLRDRHPECADTSGKHEYQSA